MKHIYTFLLFLFFAKSAFSQVVTIPISNLLEVTKKTVLPVICFDTLSCHTIASQGTSVLLSYNGNLLFLTCEHVLAIRDSNDKFIKYFSNIFANVNNVDGTVTSIKLNIAYADSINDFALLYVSKDSRNILSSMINKIILTSVQRSLWKTSNDLKEGDTIIYIGYPMAKGIGEHNYPLSRTGIISQLIPEKDNFLIDGFVQHGHSGSPVFLIREIDRTLPPRWGFYLIGIATAFPKEFTEVFEEVRFIKDPKMKALINPGFTYVTAMNKIIPIIEKKYDIK